MEMDRLEKLRPVGRLERYSTARHDLKFYFNAAVTASYQFPATSSLPLKNYIYAACKTVVARHPILSAIPVNESSNDPQFVRLPEIDLDRCVSFHERQRHDPTKPPLEGVTSGTSGPEATGDAELDELLTIQHNTPFEPPHPFWRLCVLTDATNPHHFTATFVFHHALSDGTSGMAFHRTFHQALPSSQAESDSAAIIPSPSTPLLPSVEALHPMPVSIFHLLTILFKAKIWSSRDPALWTGSKISVPLENRIRHIAFPRSLTRDFVKTCRANDTTVTAALQTLIAGVLFPHLPETFTSLKCAGAISMRRWLPEDVIDDDSMGVFVQDYTEDYSRQKFQTDRLPWNEAQRSRVRIENVLSLKGKNAGPNLLRYVNDYQQELFLPKIGKDRDSSYEVSNLGVFKSERINKAEGEGDEDSCVQIGRMVFTQSANVAGSAFEVSAVTGEDGCLVLGFSWQKGVVDDSLMDEVIKGVEEEVTRLA